MNIPFKGLFHPLGIRGRVVNSMLRVLFQGESDNGFGICMSLFELKRYFQLCIQPNPGGCGAKNKHLLVNMRKCNLKHVPNFGFCVHLGE